MGLFSFFKKEKKEEVQVTDTSPLLFHEYTPSELDQQREQKVDIIRKLAQKSFPSKNGLLPHEISVLASAHRYKTSENNFPKYWYFDYAIDDPQKILDMLLERKFIRKATAKESLEQLRVSELKEILSVFGIQAKGKKSDLVAAIQENVTEEDLFDKIPVRSLILTELGEQELKENEYVKYCGPLGKHGFTMWDMNREIQNYPPKLFRDIIWRRFNQREQEYIEKLSKDEDFYSYYNFRSSLLFEMCDFLIEEKRHPKDALSDFSVAIYYDIKIISAFRFKTALTYMVNEYDKPTFKDCADLSHKVSRLSYLQKILEFNKNELKDFITTAFKREPIQYNRLKQWEIYPFKLEDSDIANLLVSEIEHDEIASDIICREIENEIKTW